MSKIRTTPPRRHFRFTHQQKLVTATVDAKQIVFRTYRARKTHTLSLADAFDTARGQKLLKLQ